MARGGINKALVQKARQAILARGDNPSIDALRVELGNTGSKTTIHRYLKELESEVRGPAGQPLPLGDELGNLVMQLAERLQQEARDSVADDRARLSRERLDYQQQVRLAQARIEQLESQNQALETRLKEALDSLQLSQQQKHQGELTNARLRQAAGDLETRLGERDAQIASLEEKHNHARIALEHFRQAAKEQREQEQRQHEARIQQLGAELRQLQQNLVLRQDELTRLNRDNERLLTEARLLRNEQHEQQQQLARQALANEALRQERAQAEGARTVLEQRNQALDAELGRLDQHSREQAGQLQALQRRLLELSAALSEESPSEE
ncbi:DNA-binding protein [Pseudomonas citronellolis]|uniref:DNA-binding protein n=1 Tax=Pseudomonas citronellolis TaxID=53408 RepID=UPI0023E376DC|nr:DNA-binding protein [Pseudomonas citronellolis]MDF3934461.1 DNA-binding protein [Pseudomonas citronellolis]